MKHAITVKKIAFHRNGMSGEPFYVVLFTCEDAEPPDLVGIVPPRGLREDPNTAVLAPQLLVEGNITMLEGGAFRGDNFDQSLREAIYHQVLGERMAAGHLSLEEARKASRRDASLYAPVDDAFGPQP